MGRGEKNKKNKKTKIVGLRAYTASKQKSNMLVSHC